LKNLTIHIKGFVQGVGFRYFCYKAAIKYNINGFVRNLNDGSVLLDIEGDEKDINLFLDEIKEGSRFTKINSIKTEEKKFENKYTKFDIL